MIKISTGTASVLGLKETKSDTEPTTAYLMAGENCAKSCLFCSQGKGSKADSRLLSRVSWPAFDRDVIFSRLEQSFTKNSLKRACIQRLESDFSADKTKEMINQIKEKATIPLCLSANISSLEEAREIMSLGVDRMCIPLDVASPKLFKKIKGGNFEEKIALLEECARLFPKQVSTHLIVGLGESEEEMIKEIARLSNLGITIGLFAFTPVKGTKMEKMKPPDIDHYRKIQIAHYLLKEGFASLEKLHFEKGKFTDIAIDKGSLKEYLKKGEAFQTSGCPDCNRPYFNERPGGVIYNYPRSLTLEEINLALKEAGLF